MSAEDYYRQANERAASILCKRGGDVTIDDIAAKAMALIELDAYDDEEDRLWRVEKPACPCPKDGLAHQPGCPSRAWIVQRYRIPQGGR